MKVFWYLFGVALICIILIKCGHNVNEIGESEHKAQESFRVDSLQQIKTDSLKAKYDSLITASVKSDSASAARIAALSKEYYRLRNIVKGMNIVLVDTSKTLSADQYNAFVESGNLCDSLLSDKDKRIAGKDSIIHYQGEIIRAEEVQNQISEQAVSDYKQFAEEEKRAKEKAKKLNRAIPKIAAAFTAVGSIITIVLLNAIK